MLFENSKMRVLKGKTITEELKTRIISINALLVMKIISCRQSDIRDVFMMLQNAENIEWVKSEVSAKYDLNERAGKISEKVNSKQFKTDCQEFMDFLSRMYLKNIRKQLFYCRVSIRT